MNNNLSFENWLDFSLSNLSTLISIVQDAGVYSVEEGNRLYSDYFFLLKIYRAYKNGLHKSNSD